MKIIKNFISFWYNFIFGDDWLLAVIIICGILLLKILVYLKINNIWWILPLLTIEALIISLYKELNKDSKL